MAKRKSMSMQPAVTDLNFLIPAGAAALGASTYIDTARELSKINRRGYSQSRMYGYQGLTFIWRAAPAAIDLQTVELQVSTAGNTWVLQNAHTKGHALWNEMQALVLADNPSVKGKWHDFKVKLNLLMTTGRIMDCTDSAGLKITDGEWDYSTFVMPEHDVDPVTGLPLDADEFTAVLIGAETTIPRVPPATGFTGHRNLVLAYEQSRATVQPTDPNLPAGLSTSFFNLLTDSGSQEPELALVIKDENNEPPYDVDNYVGGTVNGTSPLVVGFAAISASEVDGRIGGFVAPCGLLQLDITGFDSDGEAVSPADMPELQVILHVAPGSYKGVASIPMGQ